MNCCYPNDQCCKVVRLAPGQQVCVTKTTYCLGPPPLVKEEKKCNPVITVQCCPENPGQDYCITPNKCCPVQRDPCCPPPSNFACCPPVVRDCRQSLGWRNNGFC
ncbi:hypothetical protein GJ496_000498 [Pomphorhynchus laevis]|nr:hypothetical protein GJ496_000498 [Pomphorhynchus laevis]